MSTGVNRVILIGNLGRDPELRHTKSNTPVCNLRVAVGERKKDGDEYRDHTEWFDVVVFGRDAENAGQYLSKGRQVYAEGRLQTRKWQDSEGKDRYRTEVVAYDLRYLGRREEAQTTEAVAVAA